MNIFDQLICVTVVGPIIHSTVMAWSAMISTTPVLGRKLHHWLCLPQRSHKHLWLAIWFSFTFGDSYIILCRHQLGSKFEIRFLFSSFDWAWGRIANAYRLRLFLASTRDKILALSYSKGTLTKEDKYSLYSDVFTWYDEMFHNSHIIIQVKQHEWFWSSWQ